MKQLFLDLDGCLANFDESFPRIFGIDHKTIPEIEMWQYVTDHPNYFACLSLMPGAKETFDKLQKYNPIILTGAPKSCFDKAAQNKVEWVKKHLSTTIEIIVVMGGRRKPEHMRNPGDVLLDDWEKNINWWNDAGGEGILYRNNVQALHDIENIFK